MIVLGVDPGSLATGYGVIVTEPRLQRIAGGVIRPAAGAALAERLREIYLGITSVLEEFGPAEMAVESVFNARNARSSLILGHARGAILLAGAMAQVAIAEYAPREIKQAVTGNGAARKEQVRFMVVRCLALAGPPPALDQSDALAVALCHATRGAGNARLRAAGGGM